MLKVIITLIVSLWLSTSLFTNTDVYFRESSPITQSSYKEATGLTVDEASYSQYLVSYYEWEQNRLNQINELLPQQRIPIITKLRWEALATIAGDKFPLIHFKKPAYKGYLIFAVSFLILGMLCCIKEVGLAPVAVLHLNFWKRFCLMISLANWVAFTWHTFFVETAFLAIISHAVIILGFGYAFYFSIQPLCFKIKPTKKSRRA